MTGSTDRDGAFLEWLHNVFGVERAIVAVDPRSASFDPVLIKKIPIDVQILKADSDRPLHAKLCWLSGLNGDAALMGSANCSRSAWLRDPADGGNIEAVSVYDQIPRELVEEVAGVFEDAEPYALTPTEKEEVEPSGDGFRFRLSEINWDPRNSELMIRFIDELPTGTLVTVDLEGKIAECQHAPADLSTWVAVVTLEETARTRFAVVTIVSADGSEKKTRMHWVNNHAELIHAAHGRQIENVLDGMRRSPLPAEQRRILRELHQIGTVLLTDLQAFPDPRRTPVARCEKDRAEGAEEVPPVDPETLVRSLAEETARYSSDLGGRSMGFSLYGVMRALYGVRKVWRQLCREGSQVDRYTVARLMREMGLQGRGPWTSIVILAPNDGSPQSTFGRVIVGVHERVFDEQPSAPVSSNARPALAISSRWRRHAESCEEYKPRPVQKHKRTQDRLAGTFRNRRIYA